MEISREMVLAYQRGELDREYAQQVAEVLQNPEHPLSAAIHKLAEAGGGCMLIGCQCGHHRAHLHVEHVSDPNIIKQIDRTRNFRNN